MRQIIALGGGGFGSSLENLKLDEYLLSLCAAARAFANSPIVSL